jgi:hypothetical protein
MAKRRYRRSTILRDFGPGQVAHARLIFNARIYFFIYLDILDQLWEQMINYALRKKVDRTSLEYHNCAVRLGEWRRSWWTRMIAVAKEIQYKIMINNNWADMNEGNLLKVRK